MSLSLDLEALRDQVRPESLVLLAGALGGLAVVALFLYGVKPPLAEYRALRVERSTAELGAASDADSASAAIAAAQTELGRLREELYGGAARVPLRQIQAFVIDSLDQIAERHAVELIGITPGEVSAVLMFEELPYEVHVVGGYFDLFAWLREVETRLAPMVVKEFSMQREARSDRVELELALVAYRAEEAGP